MKRREEKQKKKKKRRIDTINQLPTTHIDWANWIRRPTMNERKKETEEWENRKRITASIAFVHANNNYIISYELHCKCGLFDTIDIYARLPHRAAAAADDDADYIPNKRVKVYNNWSRNFGVCVCEWSLGY